MSVLETLQNKVIKEVEERLQQRELEKAIKDAYPQIVGKLYDKIEGMLKPLTESLQAYEPEVVNEVFSIQREGDTLTITVSDKSMVFRPAGPGHEQTNESPWTLFIEDRNHRDIERFFLDRDENDFYWTVLRGRYTERVSDQEIWSIIQKALLPSEVV